MILSNVFVIAVTILILYWNYRITVAFWRAYMGIVKKEGETCLKLLETPVCWVNGYLESFTKERERKDKLRAREFMELIKVKQAALETCQTQISQFSDIVPHLDENQDVYNYRLQDPALSWMTYADILQSDLIKLKIDFEITLPEYYYVPT